MGNNDEFILLFKIIFEKIVPFLKSDKITSLIVEFRLLIISNNINSKGLNE